MQSDLEKQREYNREYQRKNHNRILELKRRYRQNHLKESREWANKYTHSHPDQIRARRAALPSCYYSWVGMRQRCDNPNSRRFYMYGAKGITYDLRWQSFDAFYVDMGDKPKGFDLHRIDNTKGYSKSNCIWISKSEHSKITRAENRKSA